MTNTDEPGKQPGGKRSLRKSTIGWIVAVVLVALLAVYAFGGPGSSSGVSNTMTTSTSYNIAAPSVVLAAALLNPAGYNNTSSGLLGHTYPGEQSAAFAILNQPQSAANVTVAVFSSTTDSQSYYDALASHVQGLPGYTDISSVLGGYEQYGRCYGYGEDVDGIAVANGICTDGNVFMQVHLSSSESFTQVEGDLSSLMGALYENVQ